MAAVISVFSFRGGVGRTTTVSAIGSFFSMRKAKVLMLDLCHNSTLTVSYIDKSATSYKDNLYDAVVNGATLSVFSAREHLTVAACGAGAHMLDQHDRKKAQNGFSRLLTRLSSEYDIILIDCPANLTTLTGTCISMSDRVMIPVTADGTAGFSLAMTMSFVMCHSKESVTDVFFTMHNPREKISVVVEKAVRESYPDCVMDTRIRRNVSLCEAPGHFQSIFEYKPLSAGAEDYARLCDEFYHRLMGAEAAGVTIK